MSPRIRLKNALCSFAVQRSPSVLFTSCFFAQGRASVGLHTEMYFANNPTEEDAFVLSVDTSKLSVIVPRFGIEGTVRILQLL